MSSEVCTCPIRPRMSYDELMNQIFIAGKNCCDSRNAPHKGWTCPVLLFELRRAEIDRDRISRYKKRLQREGYTPDQIQNKPFGGRARYRVTAKAAEIEL